MLMYQFIIIRVIQCYLSKVYIYYDTFVIFFFIENIYVEENGWDLSKSQSTWFICHRWWRKKKRKKNLADIRDRSDWVWIKTFVAKIEDKKLPVHTLRNETRVTDFSVSHSIFFACGFFVNEFWREIHKVILRICRDDNHLLFFLFLLFFFFCGIFCRGEGEMTVSESLLLSFFTKKKVNKPTPKFVASIIVLTFRTQFYWLPSKQFLLYSLYPLVYFSFREKKKQSWSF